MIEHTLKVITLRRGRFEKKRRVIRFEDHSYELLGTFINAEADSFRSQIADAFVQAEQDGEGYFAGNMTSLAIHDGTAVLTSQIDSDAEPLSVPAEEVIALLEEWYDR